MKSSWILLVIFVLVFSPIASAGVAFSGIFVSADTDDHVDSFVLSQERKSNDTLVDVLNRNKLTYMADLINRTDLTKALTSNDNYTVLAPTNSALNSLPYTIRKKLLTNPDFAKLFVEYHILNGSAPSKSIQSDQVNSTLLSNRTVRFNRYTVNKKDEITVNGVVLEKVDLYASNGLVHVLDRALWPQAQHDIIDAISHTKSLSTFAKAIGDGGVNGTLSGNGPFTIFAPTNEACKKHGTIKIKDAKKIVQYHSAGETLYSAGLYDGEKFKTMYKRLFAKLKIHIKDGKVSVKGRHETAEVIVADIPVNNGVLHIIDTVLTPPWI